MYAVIHSKWLIYILFRRQNINSLPGNIYMYDCLDHFCDNLAYQTALPPLFFGTKRLYTTYCKKRPSLLFTDWCFRYFKVSVWIIRFVTALLADNCRWVGAPNEYDSKIMYKYTNLVYSLRDSIDRERNMPELHRIDISPSKHIPYSEERNKCRQQQQWTFRGGTTVHVKLRVMWHALEIWISQYFFYAEHIVVGAFFGKKNLISGTAMNTIIFCCGVQFNVQFDTSGSFWWNSIDVSNLININYECFSLEIHEW